MNIEQKKKLIESINKSGFPTELKVGNIFINKDWNVEHNPFYIDLDEKKGRKIDLITRYTIQYDDKLYHEISFNFVIEIKRETNKPWIVFTSKSSHFERLLGLPKNFVQINFNKGKASRIFSKYNISLSEDIGRTAFEGFSSGKDKLFGSLCNTTKAFVHAMKSDYIHRDKSTDKLLSYYEPMIVLDGELIEAKLGSQSDIDLIERNYVQVAFNYLSPEYNDKKGRNIIHIVKKDFLSEYLDNRVNQFNEIAKRLAE